MMNISNCNKKILVILLIVAILVILAVVAYLIYYKTDIENFDPTTGSSTTAPNTTESSTTTPNTTGSSTTTVPNATESSATTMPNAIESSTTMPNATESSTTAPNAIESSTTPPNTTESSTTTVPNAIESSTTPPNTTIANSQKSIDNSASALLNGLGTAVQSGIRTELGIHGVNGNLGNKDNNLLGNNIYVSPMNNDTLYNPQAKLSQLGKINSSFFPMIKIAQ